MKRLIYITLFTVGFNLASFAQTGPGSHAQVNFIKFYPNPASASINFDFQRNYDKTYSLQVYNFMGKKVYEVKNTPRHMYLNLEEFYRGIYIYQLRDKSGLILESGKFQVVK